MKKTSEAKDMKKTSEAKGMRKTSKAKQCQNPECEAMLFVEKSSRDASDETYICPRCGYPNVFDEPQKKTTQKKSENLSDILGRLRPSISKWQGLPLYSIKLEMITDELIAEIKKISKILQKMSLEQRHEQRDSESWKCLGDICYRIREFNDAKLFYSQAILVDASYPDPYCKLGKIAMETNDFMNAELYFQRALTYHPGSDEALNGLADLEVINNNLKSALEKYQDILKRFPDNVESRLGIAHIYYLRKEYWAMEPYIKKILEIAPDNPDVYYLLGLKAHQNKNYSIAEWSYKKSLELDNYNCSTWTSLGALYIELRYHAQAKECLKKAAAIDPNQAKIWSNYGFMEFQIFNYLEAEQYFKKALELDPKEASAWNNLAVIYHDVRKQYTEAERCYKQALELTPNDKKIWQSYGNLLTLMGRTIEANRAFEKAGTATKSGCFIATAAFGTPIASELDTLRDYRDFVLKKHWIGRLFIFVYYRISPSIATIIRKYEGMRACVRLFLSKIIPRIKKFNDLNDEHEKNG